jgi:hypothetical protein
MVNIIEENNWNKKNHLEGFTKLDDLLCQGLNP